MMKATASALIGLGLAGTSLAQGAGEDMRIVRSVTIDDLKAVVSMADGTISSTDEEEVTVTATSPDGLIYSLDGTACADGSCLGINMVVSYTKSDDIDLNDLNRANVKYAAVSVWTITDSYGVSRYLILDGGQTMENLRVNLVNLLNIAPLVNDLVNEDAVAAADVGNIDFGDDTGSDANDGVCDDGRFHPDGDDYNYTRRHVLRDATDCREAVQSGLKSLTLDFGDDSGDYTFDGECDDNRFTGAGRSILTTDSQVKKDASDCIAAYRDGKLDRP
ncbi:MAG: YbjN domain-containing protein [Alphaproteobacteria bacterium]|nr:YbjN domain-containing protein [Alphaproteobacteria bacterium]